MSANLWNGLVLLPQRAVWRPETRTLFVADVHIGKAAAFRAAGVPAPAGTTRENLARLDALIEALNPRELVVLGDLFHARAAYRSTTLAQFAAWRARRAALAIRLVAGNHDLGAGVAPASLGLQWVDEPHWLDGYLCRHRPLDDEDADGPPVLAGHWHPATRLSGSGHDSLRLPCFLLRERQLVLPAFGEFTGGALFGAGENWTLCVAAGERVVRLPDPKARSRVGR